MLALTWTMLVIAVYSVSNRQQCPPYLKFLATAYDILMIALTIKLTEGYLGVWNMLYLLPITATALRHSLKLAYFATGLAIATYLCSLGFYSYWHVGAAKSWSGPQTTDLAVIVLSMLTTGLLAGQTIRQARRFGNIDRRGV
jgi:K+-sensing histidine kinase KdpD